MLRTLERKNYKVNKLGFDRIRFNKYESKPAKLSQGQSNKVKLNGLSLV